MRRDVTFLSKGLRCAGWLYVPDSLAAGQRVPGIVMANAISSVKEVYLSNYAERFVSGLRSTRLRLPLFRGERGRAAMPDVPLRAARGHPQCCHMA
jgi:hypothetical protein